MRFGFEIDLLENRTADEIDALISLIVGARGTYIWSSSSYPSAPSFASAVQTFSQHADGTETADGTDALISLMEKND
jgi:hypothetical protein